MKLKIYLFLFFPLCGFAQKNHYIVIYEQKMLSTEFGFSIPSKVKTYLNGDGKKSIYIEDWINQNNNDSEINFTIKAEENPTFYKNLEEHSINYNDQIRLKPFQIKDNIAPFIWTIKPETKVILGYKCQKATVENRGRSFTAYFAIDIPFSDGPWKFFGLPGLILEVQAEGTMGSLSILATKIDIKETTNEIQNPFEGKKTISYDEFKMIYNKKNDEMISQQTEDNPQRLSDGFKEVILTKK